MGNVPLGNTLFVNISFCKQVLNIIVIFFLWFRKLNLYWALLLMYFPLTPKLLLFGTCNLMINTWGKWNRRTIVFISRQCSSSVKLKGKRLEPRDNLLMGACFRRSTEDWWWWRRWPSVLDHNQRHDITPEDAKNG